MNLDVSNNRLAEIRKQLKEKRKQKSGIKIEPSSESTNEVHNNQHIENIATIIPSFSLSSSTPVFKQLHINNVQPLPPCSLITADEVGVFKTGDDVQRCKNIPQLPPPKYNISQYSSIKSEQKKRSISEPPPNKYPFVPIEEPEVKKRDFSLPLPQKQPVAIQLEQSQHGFASSQSVSKTPIVQEVKKPPPPKQSSSKKFFFF